MKYALVPIVNRSTGEVRAYASAVNDFIDFDDITKQVTQETTVTEADVKGVISALVSLMKRELLKGNEIRLSELGSMYPTFSSEGADEVEKFVPSMIKQVNIRFRPSNDLKNELKKAQFTISPTKKLIKSAVKDMKVNVQEAIDAEGDDEGGDTPNP